MLKIANKENCKDINNLLKEYNLCPMTWEEMDSGVGIVSIEEDKVVGFIWALLNKKVAVIDYLVVDKNYRKKENCSRSVIVLEMASILLATLIKRGVTKVIGILDKTDSCESMLRFYRDKLGMIERVPFAVVKGNPQEIQRKILEAKNG